MWYVTSDLGRGIYDSSWLLHGFFAFMRLYEVLGVGFVTAGGYLMISVGAISFTVTLNGWCDSRCLVVVRCGC